MNETEIGQYILDTFAGVDVVNAMDAYFYFYNPDTSVPPDHRFPFITIVTNDLHDQFSDLNRPDVFRLNIGITKQTFRARFGSPKLPEGSYGAAEDDESADNAPGGYDFTALDQVMPHPVYGRMYWVCILNPSDETFATQALPLLNEAYELAVSRYQRKEEHDRARTSQ